MHKRKYMQYEWGTFSYKPHYKPKSLASILWIVGGGGGGGGKKEMSASSTTTCPIKNLITQESRGQWIWNFSDPYQPVHYPSTFWTLCIHLTSFLSGLVHPPCCVVHPCDPAIWSKLYQWSVQSKTSIQWTSEWLGVPS